MRRPVPPVPLLAGLAVLSIAGVGLAPLAQTERTLTPLRVELRAGKGPAHRVVAVASQGEIVKVIEQDPSGWTLLERAPALGGQRGYAHQRALEAKASKPGDGNLGKALTGRSDGAQVSAAAAAKGIQPQTHVYAAGRGYDTAGLVELKRRRESVTIEEFEAFLAALKGGG